MARDWEDKFIEALTISPNVSKARGGRRISRVSAYEYKNTDEAFRNRWQAALEASLDDLEEEGFRRGKSDSDTLLIFMLKSHRRAVYGDKIQQEISGPEGGAIVHEFKGDLDRVYGDTGEAK